LSSSAPSFPDGKDQARCYTFIVVKLFIGTSGYQYDDWRGRFYPSDLPKSAWFAHYAEHFDAVELNATFYRLPEASTFDRWRNAAPAGFCYALKFSRYGTHMKKLKDPGGPIELFVERARLLGPTLGPILVQLPPRWHVDVGRLRAFLEAVPKHYRWAIELRDPSWLCEDVYALLRKHGAALCVHDLIERHPRVQTADWVYLRFHGDRYSGSYSPQALSAAARRVRAHLANGRDVYAFFNNDVGGHAVRNAADLRRYVAHPS
jgi:uncharacterized protein YecE (DUF72 family)